MRRRPSDDAAYWFRLSAVNIALAPTCDRSNRSASESRDPPPPPLDDVGDTEVLLVSLVVPVAGVLDAGGVDVDPLFAATIRAYPWRSFLASR